MFLSIAKWRGLACGLCFVLLATLLTACGGDDPASLDFSIPVISDMTEVPTISNDASFRQKLLCADASCPVKDRTNSLTNQDVKVYLTGRTPTDVTNSYETEMVQQRRWLPVTTNIILSNELGNQGVIRSYEKTVGGDSNKKHAVGVIALSPDAPGLKTNSPLAPYYTNGTIPAGKNVVIIVQSTSGLPQTPPK